MFYSILPYSAEFHQFPVYSIKIYNVLPFKIELPRIFCEIQDKLRFDLDPGGCDTARASVECCGEFL
jgi:hypothetical protein